MDVKIRELGPVGGGVHWWYPDLDPPMLSAYVGANFYRHIKLRSFLPIYSAHFTIRLTVDINVGYLGTAAIKQLHLCLRGRIDF